MESSPAPRFGGIITHWKKNPQPPAFPAGLTRLIRALRILAPALVLVWAAAASASRHGEAPGKTGGSRPVVFSVTGDVPYNPKEYLTLARYISAHNTIGKAEFLVHLGDIKGGSPCKRQIYENVAALLRRSFVPVFVIPGDNEWNDCRNPGAAWLLWEKHFIKFDAFWKTELRVKRQPARPANFAFVHGGVTFIGITLPGGRIHNQVEWDAFMRDGAEWVRAQLRRYGAKAEAAVVFAHANPRTEHALFMEQFRFEAGKFGKPVLFIHGDGHGWIEDRPWPEQNILRIQVERGGLAPPVRVTFQSGEGKGFHFERKPFR